MKILIITDAWHPQINGVVRTYEYMLPALQESGHEIKIIGPNDFPFRMKMPGYKEIEITLFPFRRLRSLIQAFDPDSIHIATEGPLGLAASRFCQQNDLPFSTAFHTLFPDYIALRAEKFVRATHRPVKNALTGWVTKFHNRAHAVLVATQSLEKTLLSWGLTAPTHELTRGVMTDIFYVDDDTRILERLPKPVALYVGRVAIEKNIPAFLEMPWTGSKVVIGDGPMLPELKKKYPDIHFLGKKTGHDLAAHYRSADIFIFPSKTDTFGMVLTEALACGLPIAAHNVTGPKDIITDASLGVLHDDLGEAARRALSAPGSRAARFQHVLEHYTWPLAARQFIEVCEKTKIEKIAKN